MFNLLNTKVIGLIGVLVVGAAGAGIWLEVHHTSPSASQATTQSGIVVHTGEWYAAHQDQYKIDTAKCEAETPASPPDFQAMCQGVFDADQIIASQLEKSELANQPGTVAPK